MCRHLFKILLCVFAALVAETAEPAEREAGWEMFGPDVEETTSAATVAPPTEIGTVSGSIADGTSEDLGASEPENLPGTSLEIPDATTQFSVPIPTPAVATRTILPATENILAESFLSLATPSGDVPVVRTWEEMELARKRKIPRIILGRRVHILEADGLYHDPILRSLKKVAESRRSGLPEPSSVTPAAAVLDATSTPGTFTRGVPPTSDDIPVVGTEDELESARARGVPRVLLGGRVFVLEEDGKYHDPILRAWREAAEKREREYMETFGPLPTPTVTPAVRSPNAVPGSVIRGVKPPRPRPHWPTRGNRRNR